MAKAILITQCLQNDFVAPVRQSDPLPNKLHIGFEEYSRLLGEYYENGILMSLMRWAYSQTSDDFKLIHIRDWHNDKDPAQKDHLEQFGKHCIQNTVGAEFIFERIRQEGKDHIVDASGLNDFVNTNLESLLDIWKEEEVFVGIIGVWTEAKVSYLTYDITTRYPNFKVAVCSALTASSTTHMHYISLEQLNSILGISVLPSVAEFGKYLGGEVPALKLGMRQSEFSFSESTNIVEEDMGLLNHLYRNSKSAEFIVLDGGFSGNIVMKACSNDVNGHEEVPTVVKIGNRNGIAGEKVAFEKVKDVLGNSAPSIVGYMETTNRAGIKYRYASMFDEKVSTFQQCYEQGCEQEKINYFLDVIFKKQLGRFYKAATCEKLDLLSYYEFSDKYGESVRQKVYKIIGLGLIKDNHLEIGGRKVSNVANFYMNDLKNIDHSLLVHSHYMSYVHGDLNGANIIIDGQANIWLIDFFHTHRGHVLKDLIKLENDILYIFMKINSEEELTGATHLIDDLIDIEDLRPGLQPKTYNKEKYDRAYSTISHMRSMYADLVDSDRSPYQLWIALLRYAVHTISFDECNNYQKKLALYTSGKLAEKIVRYAKESAGLRIDYTPSFGEQIGMTILPGRKDRNRDLRLDIQKIVDSGVDVVVPLITNEELETYGVSNLLKEYEKRNLEVRQLEISDQGIPSKQEMKELVQYIKEKLAAEKKVLVHCVGGIGRTGTLLCCCLKGLKAKSTKDAITEVRQSRSPRSVETRVQEEFVQRF